MVCEPIETRGRAARNALDARYGDIDVAAGIARGRRAHAEAWVGALRWIWRFPRRLFRHESGRSRPGRG